ncbi:MAG TPA: PadR family transcriptional regulator [Symbiobacteriaceae bacterium]|nr:PadR family transcriptional regulator [Symbiobacteriaceae bacterium]
MFRDFFLGFIRIHVLHHAAKAPVFGSELMRELKTHGCQISPGTLYPMLHDMEKAGYLRRTEHVIEGKVRKYYHITDAGNAALVEARARVRELVGEILTD